MIREVSSLRQHTETKQNTHSCIVDVYGDMSELFTFLVMAIILIFGDYGQNWNGNGTGPCQAFVWKIDLLIIMLQRHIKLFFFVVVVIDEP